MNYGISTGDSYSYGLDLHATNLRVVASKQLPMLVLAAGFGWDTYTGDALKLHLPDP
jgi:hypothetical protein